MSINIWLNYFYKTPIKNKKKIIILKLLGFKVEIAKDKKKYAIKWWNLSSPILGGNWGSGYKDRIVIRIKLNKVYIFQYFLKKVIKLIYKLILGIILY